MGVYALEPDAREYVPADRPFDLPDLVHALLEAGEPVGAYPYDGYWLDIGRHDDYEHGDRRVRRAAYQTFFRVIERADFGHTHRASHGLASCPVVRSAPGRGRCGGRLGTLRSGWLTMGPRTAEFEAAFAERLGARHAVAVSTAAPPRCTSPTWRPASGRATR